MPYLLLKERRNNQLLPTRIISDPKVAQLLLQPTRWKILSDLSDGEKCAKDLAETFHTSEQVICYHLRELEKAGIVVLERTEKKGADRQVLPSRGEGDRHNTATRSVKHYLAGPSRGTSLGACLENARPVYLTRTFQRPHCPRKPRCARHLQ